MLLSSPKKKKFRSSTNNNQNPKQESLFFTTISYKVKPDKKAMTGETSSRTGRSLDELPVDLIATIMGFVGKDSYLHMLDCKRV